MTAWVLAHYRLIKRIGAGGMGEVYLARDDRLDRDVAVKVLPEAVAGARAVLLMTRWDEFRALPGLLRDLPDAPLVIDGRRLLDPASVPRYEGIGRGSPAAPAVTPGAASP